MLEPQIPDPNNPPPPPGLDPDKQSGTKPVDPNDMRPDIAPDKADLQK